MRWSLPGLCGLDWHKAVPIGCALELVHTYSLIHDDLPALDNDDYRRGQKTCHIVYGEDMAILTGDALLNYAYEVATKAFDLVDKDQIMNVVEAIKILASKPGIYGMIGGQAADVELEGTPLSMEQILFIHKNKTSALIEACMMIGAVLAGASKEDVLKMEECGEYIGLAFQIQDDILDLTGDEEEIGKPVEVMKRITNNLCDIKRIRTLTKRCRRYFKESN